MARTRDSFDGARQREVLSKLQARTGRDATALAVEVGLGYSAYLMYIWGKRPLRTDQFEAFARAYGVNPVDLAAEIAGQDVYEPINQTEPASAWNFRDALRGHIPEYLIEKLAPQWEGRPILNQQAAVEAIREMYDERIAENTLKPRRQTAS